MLNVKIKGRINNNFLQFFHYSVKRSVKFIRRDLLPSSISLSVIEWNLANDPWMTLYVKAERLAYINILPGKWEIQENLGMTPSDLEG